MSTAATRRCRRILAGLVILMILPQWARAQSIDVVRGAGGFAGVGLRRLDIVDLNAELRRYGYNTFEQHALAIGGGGYAMRGHLLIGAEGYGLTGQRARGDDRNYTTRLTGGYGTLNLGYLAAHSQRLSVYPMIGVGGAGIQLDIAERSSPTFADVLQFPGRNSSIATGAFLVTMSMGADYQLTGTNAATRTANGRVKGLVAGLRAGYSASLASGEWSQRGTQAAAGPEVGLNGFFLTFTFGARSLMPALAF